MPSTAIRGPPRCYRDRRRPRAQRRMIAEEGTSSIAYYATGRRRQVNDGARVDGVSEPAAQALPPYGIRPHSSSGSLSSTRSTGDPEVVRVAGGRLALGLSASTSRVNRDAVAWQRRRLRGAPHRSVRIRAARQLELGCLLSTRAYDSGPSRATPRATSRPRLACESRGAGGRWFSPNPVKAPSVPAPGSAEERKPRTRTLPFGRSARFSGRLTTGSRRPMEGAPVRVVERDARDMAARWQSHGRGLMVAPSRLSAPGGAEAEKCAPPSTAGRAFAASSVRPSRLLVRGALTAVSAPAARWAGRR